MAVCGVVVVVLVVGSKTRIIRCARRRQQLVTSDLGGNLSGLI